MDYNTSSSPLWDFSQQSPSAFPQLADNDLLALIEKQFDSDIFAADTFVIPHDGVDPTKISNLAAPAPPPPLSDDSSPSPPSTTDHLSSSRRQSTNSNNEQDSPELKRKASDDGLDDESPTQKTCKLLLHVGHSQRLRLFLAKRASSRRKSTGNPSQVSAACGRQSFHVHQPKFVLSRTRPDY
jgi:AP-1-like factor